MAYVRLCLAEREEIWAALTEDRSVPWRRIAERLERHPSTIQREVDRHGGRHEYRASTAQHRAEVDQAAKATFRFDTDPELAAAIRALLKKGYSPYAAATLDGRVCAETVYQAVFSGRLEVDPATVLRTRRRRRRQQRRFRQPATDGNYLGGFSPISARPEVVDARTRVGDWEGDLIAGTRNQSAIITLTERYSRYQAALTLPYGRGADATINRLLGWLDTPELVILTLTWDQGAELARWLQLVSQGVDVFFADRRSPWQRGSNENANRQLRFWFPPGTNLNIYTQADLDHACHILNTTPRRIHNGATANHIYQLHTRTKE